MVIVQAFWKYRDETPLLLEEMILGLEDHERPEMAQEAMQEFKRRRITQKLPEASYYGRAPTWSEIMKSVGYRTWRVGATYFDEQEAVTGLVQRLIPEFRVKLMVACRGTDRHRVLNESHQGERYPWRKTVIVDRNSGEIREVGPVENWTALPKLKQIRSTGPAKISLTIFGTQAEPCFGHASRSSPEVPNAENQHGRSDPDSAPTHEQKPDLDTPKIEGQRLSGWGPRVIPKSGPHFEALDGEVKGDLRRLHNNLGHPDPERFARFLKDRGVAQNILRGASEMQCDTCLETQPRPKVSQPGRIHENLDFNDRVGCDGAYWTSATGKKYHFMHFIDEATLFHVGIPSGREFHEQVRAFESAWTQWAGPCKVLYMDPAGEYDGAQWSAYLQSESIRASMTAAESHWQNGRCEVHGGIIKNMLTRMEKETPVLSAHDFAKNLRHAFAAKNALSRINGFTPEQCLLGKARAIPASISSDDEASSHMLAMSQMPEGVRFRDSLHRREVARKAFIQADNDTAFRRALLRSHPGQVDYERGRLVVILEKVKGQQQV